MYRGVILSYDKNRKVFIRRCKFCGKHSVFNNEKTISNCDRPSCKIKYIKEARGD